MPRPNNDEMDQLRLWNLLTHYQNNVTFYIFKCRVLVKQAKNAASNITLSEDDIAEGLRLTLLNDDEWMKFLGRKSFLPVPFRVVITGYFARLIAFDHYGAIIT